MANQNTYDSSNIAVIANNLPPRAMRYTMESKNLLAKKGAMYIGTGETETVTIRVNVGDDSYEDITYEIPKTTAITPPTSNGTYVLTCSVSDGEITVAWVSSTGSNSNSNNNPGNSIEITTE